MKIDEKVKRAVCDALSEEGMNVGVSDLEGRQRHAEYVAARTMFAFVMWCHCGSTLEKIGSYMGRDHSISIYYRDQAMIRMQQEGWFGRAYLDVCRELNYEPANIKINTIDTPRLIRHKRKKPFAWEPEPILLGDVKPQYQWSKEEMVELKEWRKTGEAILNGGSGGAKVKNKPVSPNRSESIGRS